MTGSSRIRSDGPVIGASAPEPAEPPPPTPPPVPVAEPALPAPEPAPEPGDHVDQPPAGEETDKAALRIRQLTREKYEAERRAREAEQRWNQAQAIPRMPIPGQYVPGQSPADQAAEARAFERLQAQQAAQIFNTACDNLWDEGCREYGGDQMAEAKRALDAVGWGNDPYALQSLTELPDGHRIYRELAADLDNAARILRLPHNKRQIELAWLSNRGRRDPDNGADANREPAPAPYTRAPDPIRPIGARSAPRELPLDHKDVSMAEFIRRRDRETRPSRISR